MALSPTMSSETRAAMAAKRTNPASIRGDICVPTPVSAARMAATAAKAKKPPPRTLPKVRPLTPTRSAVPEASGHGSESAGEASPGTTLPPDFSPPSRLATTLPI